MSSKIKEWYLRFEAWYIENCLLIARSVMVFLIIGVAVLAIVVWQRDTAVGYQATPGAQSGGGPGSAPDDEIATLRAQLEQMRSHDAALRETVNTTLAILAGVAVLLVGFSWFSNVRVAERDRQQIREDLKSEMAREVDDANKRIAAALGQVEQAVVAKVSNDLGILSHEIAKSLTDTRSELTVTQLELLQSVGRSHLERGNWNELLITAQTILMIGKTRDVDRAFGLGLDLMQSALERGAKPGMTLATELREVMLGLPTKYEPEVAFVRDQLDLARQRMHSESEWEG